MSERAAGDPTTRRFADWLLPALALALALASAALAPWLALPATIGVVMVAARARGRARWWVAGLGGAAAMAGLVRFTLEWAVPNIVSSGQFAAEERAVSQLREILWAEDRALDRGWVDTDGDGRAEYAFLGELCGIGKPRHGVKLAEPLLRSTQYHPMNDGMTLVYRSEGYDYVVYLPGPSGGGVGEARGAVDPYQASLRFVAYAWPVDWGKGGTRAFYIDQDDRICETNNAQGYSGLHSIPAPNAALGGSGLGSAPCGEHTTDGGNWKPWKNKKPRSPRQ